MGEGLKLVIDKLLKVFDVLKENELEHLLDAGHLDRIWEKDILGMHRDLKEWEISKLGKKYFSAKFDPLVKKLNEMIKARNSLDHATELSKLREKHTKEQLQERDDIFTYSLSATNRAAKAVKIEAVYNGSPHSSDSSQGVFKKKASLVDKTKEKTREAKHVPRVRVINTDMLIENADERSVETP